MSDNLLIPSMLAGVFGSPHMDLTKKARFVYHFLRGAEVAQLVEQRTENPRVGSSILPLGTIFMLD